jgi:hypothetical protein
MFLGFDVVNLPLPAFLFHTFTVLRLLGDQREAFWLVRRNLKLSCFAFHGQAWKLTKLTEGASAGIAQAANAKHPANRSADSLNRAHSWLRPVISYSRFGAAGWPTVGIA